MQSSHPSGAWPTVARGPAACVWATWVGVKESIWYDAHFLRSRQTAGGLPSYCLNRQSHFKFQNLASNVSPWQR